jgi:lipoate-protein ligase A
MHGEYKTPGGKLVVVDFGVRGGQLTEVVISGDFFLYPDDALVDLQNALEGLSVEVTESEIAERVRFGLRRNAELLGTSPEGIAAAVRRALSASAAAAEERG